MRRAPATVASLLAALVLAAPAAADTRSRDLRVATTTKIGTLNVLTGTLASEYRVWALNFDILVAFDAKTMQPDPAHSLATKVTQSPDGLTWTYELRKGVRWSDGKPLTAADVVWTMRFMHRRAKLPEIAAVKKWEAKGATTVIAHLSHRSVTMNALWIYILPEHIWKHADNDDWRDFEPRQLVGSGPYTVTRWNPDGTTVMDRNPHFWRPNSGPQRVLMTYYGRGSDAVADLERGRLDVMPTDTLDAQDVRRLRRSSGVRVYQSPSIGLEYWVFDLAPHVASRVHKSVVQDLAIRTALAWAIDRPKLVQASLFGLGAPGNTQLSRNYGRYWLDLSKDPELGYHYDPARARQILEAAGWKVGPGGIRRKHGARAAFELAYGGSASEQRAVTLLRTWARAVGIAIDVRTYDFEKLIKLEFNTVDGAVTPEFDSEIWSIGGDPTPEFLLSLFTKAQIGTWNDSGWVDPQYEQLARQEVQAPDDGARVNAARQMQRLAAEKLPYIELYEPDDLAAVNTRTWTHWTTQPSPTGQPITSYGYATIIALRPGALATADYPGVPWALAALGALVVVAIGSSLVARRREAHEPVEREEVAV